ncbi:hypothetical protein TraAM80_08029 [Trypanosoma rangeli]|uniref:Flagellar attachment zone protein 1 conserved domain-containing protein n=1 Tax=Trypanosoma rangeli TaxID=5698 RepID=A0A3R7N496_TRYRA|nr:uncharacterized protein TraAM80_08029 [Trypanosoma rangeli]RNE99890.1 hypothetical protein TraAM80_08029 [Trypanosoma rangeli]|eukprot:RNE99890.1 hypothetical protein TraAM80_08029 [Trypanosoma rangeli]
MKSFGDGADHTHDAVVKGNINRELFNVSGVEQKVNVDGALSARVVPLNCEDLAQMEDHDAGDVLDYDDDNVTTNHKVEFKGGEWKAVMEKHYDELYAVFRSSTANALGLLEADVFGISFSIGSLVAQFSIRHPLSFSASNIDQALVTNDYAEVWALYYKEEKRHEMSQLATSESLLTSSMSPKKIQRNITDRQWIERNIKDKGTHDISIHPTARESCCVQHTVRHSNLASASAYYKKKFPGELWGSILKDHNEELQRAIERDFSDATSIAGKLKTTTLH